MKLNAIWIAYLAILSYMASTDLGAAQTTPPPPCDENAIASCLVPLQVDSIFAAVLTASNAFNLVALAENGERLCQSSYSRVEACITPLLQVCYNRPTDTYSAVAYTMKVFCHQGTKVFLDHACLSKKSLLNKIDTCQQAAGLYTTVAGVCQTMTTLRGCIDGSVIEECEDYVDAVQQLQNVSEAMLLPVRVHHSCPVLEGPGPYRVPLAAPVDCGDRAAECLQNLQALSGTSSISSPSISLQLTMAPHICRAYSNLQKCIPQLRDCQQAISSSMAEYSHLETFCTFNTTDIEKHRCLQAVPTRRETSKCDNNAVISSDIAIEACSNILQHKTCLSEAIVTSCGADISDDVAVIIDKAFIPHTRASRCDKVLSLYRENSCLRSRHLEQRFRNCMNITGTDESNKTDSCSALRDLDQCAELAVRDACGDEAIFVSRAKPLVHRVVEYAAVRMGCRIPVKEPVSTGRSLLKTIEEMITPISVAAGFLIFCVLVASLALCVTYCMYPKRPAKDAIIKDGEDSTGGTLKSKKRKSKGDDEGEVYGDSPNGNTGGGAESALEVEEVNIQDQSINEDYDGWYGTR